MSETHMGRTHIYDDSVRQFLVEAAPKISWREWNAETTAILRGIKQCH